MYENNLLYLMAIPNTNTYQLDRPYIYIDELTDTIIIAPRGFITNFASIPSCLKWVIDDNDYRIRSASVTHDFLYSKESTYLGMTRKQADKALKYNMKKLGASWVTRNLVYCSVRAAGFMHYKKQ